MRGPNDDVAAQQILAEVGAAEDDGPPPLPGGKPLLRLLQLLATEGRSEEAEASIRLAVPVERQDEARTLAAAVGAAPGGEAATAPSSGRRRRVTKAQREAAAEPVEAKDVAQAFMDAAEQLGPPTGTGPQWRWLGPTTIPNGQTYGASRVNVSGRVSAIAVDPGNAAHVLAGGANGGVWESFNRGGSWAPRTDYQATLTVGAIAFDPSNRLTVYCGTVEGNWWWYLGAGILRSSDGGTSWTPHCTAPFVGQGFYALIVDSANRNHLLAGTTAGLYVSTNGGTAWTQRRSRRTWEIAMAPAGGASAEILAACVDGLYRSTNGGTSWAAVALPGSPGAFDRLSVGISRSNPAVAYAWGASGGTAHLWRRAGGAWTAVAPPPGVATGQAWYDWFLAVAPDNANQVYCGAIETHRGDLAGGVWTWRNLTNKGAVGQSIHPDQHAIAFEPGTPNTIYVGNDGGLYRSPDRGITWVHCNNGLGITEFEYLAQDLGTSRWIIGGTQDNGTERWTGSGVWDHVDDGDGGDVAVNRTNPNIVFHTYFNMSPVRSTTKGNFSSWTGIVPAIPAGEGSLFYPPLECSASGGNTVAIGGGALYVSRNNGAAWTRLAFPNGGTASAMYIPNPDNVYVGLTDGRIFRTRWNGVSWTALTALTTPRAGAWVSDLWVDPNLTRIWATHTSVGGGRVWRSDNGGASWTNQSTAALPALPINAIQVHPSNANRAWVAADLGVYQTLNGGASWSDFSNGLPNAFVGDLIYHQHARVLRAGTRNRGVWEIPVDGWMTAPACGVQWTGNLAGNASQRWFTFNWPATWHIVWTVMPTTPRPGAPQVTWSVQVERASAEFVTYWITVRNLTPDPVTFEGRYCILSRY
jgi:hypothetical protein